MDQNKIPKCFICNEIFKDFKELARHVIANKKTHGKSYFWAQKVLTDAERLNFKTQSFEGRSPLTEEEREAKRESRRELSGEDHMVSTFCPHCKNSHTERIPQEYIESNTAWREKGKLVVLCDGCMSQKSRRIYL